MGKNDSFKLHISDSGIVTLETPDAVTGSKFRNIGQVIGKTFYTKRNDSHVFQKMKSIGVNYQLLKTGLFDSISVNCFPSGGQLFVSVEDILTKGKFLYFKNSGFEKQIFLPLSEWRPI